MKSEEIFPLIGQEEEKVLSVGHVERRINYVNRHIMICHKYEDLRRGLNLGQNWDIISYFRADMRCRVYQENTL